MKAALVLAASLVGLAGCSSIPFATKMTPEQSSGFFSAGRDSKNGTVFFICGRQTVATPLMTQQGDSPACQYSVDSTVYKGLEKGSVGRLDLKPGTHEISQSDPTGSSSMIVPLKLELRAGELALVKAHFDMKTGALGGALSGVRVFTVDYDKEDVLAKVKGKQPVLMEPMQ